MVIFYPFLSHFNAFWWCYGVVNHIFCILLPLNLLNPLKMAKVKFGMMMTDARGKLGGQVFSKNRAGSFVRTKVTPANPNTEANRKARALFFEISQQWSSLSQQVRDSFDAAVQDWARTDIFGDLRNPTRKNLCQSLTNQAQ